MISISEHLISFEMLLLLFLLGNIAAGVPCAQQDHSSLLGLKQALVFNPINSTKLVTWNSSSDCCAWGGVSCGEDGHVIALRLSYESISAGIDDSNSPLFDLHHLQALDLSQNSFNGTHIPSGIGKLLDLVHLELSYSGFRGQVPAQLSSLTSLLTLDLSSFSEALSLELEKPDLSELVRNMTMLTELRLDGVIVSAEGEGRALSSSLPHLKLLSLNNCSLSGSLHTSLINLLPLTEIQLSDNKLLKGTLPEFIGNMTELTTLDLGRCRFSGSIADIHWEQLVNIVNLDLSENVLNGSIPLSLFSLPALECLYLHGNQFSGQVGEFSVTSSSLALKFIDLSSNKLEGPIPASVFNLGTLEWLVLTSNNFSGTVDLSKIFQNLGNLRVFHLSFNSLSIIESVGSTINSSFPSPLQALNLASCNLTTFPSMLRNHSSLAMLDLSENKIVGEIPLWVWKVNLQYIKLSHNFLTGFQDSSPDLTSLSFLVYLDLSSNLLQGSIPHTPLSAKYLDYSSNRFDSRIPFQIGNYLPNVGFLSLSNNKFHGSIPTSFCNIPGDITPPVVDLSNNSLSGTIPPCLIAMSFGVLDLKENKLNGSIPDAFQNRCSLQTLDLSGNQLQGMVPRSMWNCKGLEVLNLGKNEISDGFPCWLMHISNLRVLVLRSNKFRGSVRCQVHNSTSGWPNLQIIDIAANNFGGDIPRENFKFWKGMMAAVQPKSDKLYFGINGDAVYYQNKVTIINKGLLVELVKILTIFNSIDFSCNHFEGAIPLSIGDLRSLYALNISNNHLTGRIPSSIGELDALESLDLANNSLSGAIPEQLASLTFISVLNLSYNRLTGKIPTSTQLQSFSESSYRGNKDLHGPPLEINDARTSDPHTSSFDEDLGDDGKEINWLIISFEIGIIVGLTSVIGSLMFWSRWRIWYFERVDWFLFWMFPRLNPDKTQRRRVQMPRQ